jgi:hypothetical protein
VKVSIDIDMSKEAGATATQLRKIAKKYKLTKTPEIMDALMDAHISGLRFTEGLDALAEKSKEKATDKPVKRKKKNDA